MRSRITLNSVHFVALIAAVAMFVSSCEQKQSNPDQIHAAIVELLGHTPEITWSADITMRSGETRQFTIRVHGLSREDEVTKPPVVQIYHEGGEFHSIAFTGDATGIRDSMITDGPGNRMRLYTYAWTASAPGRYEFWILAGTNHIAKVADANTRDAIKLGALTFSREEIKAALASDPTFRDIRLEQLIERNANLDPVKFLVTVTE